MNNYDSCLHSYLIYIYITKREPKQIGQPEPQSWPHEYRVNIYIYKYINILIY